MNDISGWRMVGGEGGSRSRLESLGKRGQDGPSLGNSTMEKVCSISMTVGSFSDGEDSGRHLWQ